MRRLLVGALALVAMVGTSCSHGIEAARSTPGSSAVVAQGAEPFGTAGAVDRGPFDVSNFTELRLHASNGCEATLVGGSVTPDGSFVQSASSASNTVSTTPANSVMVHIQSAGPTTCAWQLVGKAGG
jgi:hypothetical protein